MATLILVGLAALLVLKAAAGLTRPALSPQLSPQAGSLVSAAHSEEKLRFLLERQALGGER